MLSISRPDNGARRLVGSSLRFIVGGVFINGKMVVSLTVCLIWKDNNAGKYFTKATEGYNFFARLVNIDKVCNPIRPCAFTGLVNHARLVYIVHRLPDLIKSISKRPWHLAIFDHIWPCLPCVQTVTKE